RVDRAGSEVAVAAGIRSREVSLPYVHQVLAVGLEFVTPREHLPREPPACREFPFALGRTPLPCPGAVRQRVVPGHVHDGVVEPLVHIRMGTIWMPPVRTLDFAPPRGLRG